jgi:hypothetical protein
VFHRVGRVEFHRVGRVEFHRVGREGADLLPERLLTIRLLSL